MANVKEETPSVQVKQLGLTCIYSVGFSLKENKKVTILGDFVGT